MLRGSSFSVFLVLLRTHKFVFNVLLVFLLLYTFRQNPEISLIVESVSSVMWFFARAVKNYLVKVLAKFGDHQN